MEPPNSGVAPEAQVCGDQATPIPIDVYGNTPTLESTLHGAGFVTILNILDRSLEDLKGNKKERDDHSRIFNYLDHFLLRPSQERQLDRFQTGSDLQKARAHEMHTSLNVTRTVLRTLTEEFLRNIDIDYKYAYFAHLDVGSLANEGEIDSQLGDVFRRLCELSEIKRVRVIGEIRNFLAESQKCVRSYLEEPGDFVKYRDSALLHLEKCIGGYSELIQQCEMLEKECSRDGKENTRRVIHEVKTRNSIEPPILVSLRETAKDSLENNFQSFDITENMDEYFVLPFAYYVNVLLMCNATVERKKISNFTSGDRVVAPYFKLNCDLFADAYLLAVYLYDGRGCPDVLKSIVKKGFPKRSWKRDKKGRLKIPESLVRRKFNMVLEDIMDLLEVKYSIDAYGGDERLETRKTERLKEERLKKALAVLQGQEKCLMENISICEKENQELRERYEKVVMKNEKAQKEMRESMEQSEKAGGRPLLKRGGNAAENSGASQNCNRENETDMELDKIEGKGEELHKTINRQITEFLSDIQQNSRENEPHVSQEIEGRNDPAAEKDVEIVRKIKESLKESKEINKELSSLLLNCEQNIAEHSGRFENEIRENKLQQILKDSEQMKMRIREIRDLGKRIAGELME